MLCVFHKLVKTKEALLQPSHMNYAVASDYRFVTWTTTIPQGLSCNIDALLSIHWEWCGGVIELRTNT